MRHYKWEWDLIPLKNGKPGRRVHSVPVYYTPINCCDVCGTLVPPKKVCDRSGVWGWNFDGPKDYKSKSKSMLCMGCWNKIRPLHKKAIEVDELRTLINRLNRTISDEKKRNNQNHR